MVYFTSIYINPKEHFYFNWFCQTKLLVPCRKMKGVGVDKSWLVILYSFLVHFAIDVSSFSLGVLGEQLIERRNFNRESMAWISTLQLICWKLFGFVASGLYHLYGCRIPLIIGGVAYFLGHIIPAFTCQNEATVLTCLGFLAGFGISLLYTPTWIAANTYFDKYRQLANALVVTGSQVAVIVSPPCTHWLLGNYGLQGTFMILGAIVLNTVVIGALFPPLESQNHESQEEMLHLLEPKDDNKSDVQTEGKKVAKYKLQNFKNFLQNVKFQLKTNFIALDLLQQWKYTVFVIAMGLMDPVALHTTYTYLPDFIIHAGYPSDMSWIPLTISGVTNTVARLVIGIGNKTDSTIAVLCAVSAIHVGVSIISLPFISGYFWMICVSAAIFGLAQGIFFSFRGPVLAEIVGLEKFDLAAGTEQTLTFFLIFACPLQGKLYDITAEYTGTFMLSGTMATVAGVLLCTIAISVYSLVTRK